MRKEERFFDQTYRRNFAVVLTDDIEWFNEFFGIDNKYVFAHFVSPVTADHEGIEYEFKYFVYNDRNPDAELDYSVVAHECYHALNSVFEDIGQTINYSEANDEFINDEFGAYYLEYLVRENINALKKMGANIK